MTLADPVTRGAAVLDASLAALMDDHDRAPRPGFPHVAWGRLAAGGLTGFTAGGDVTARVENDVVRAVAHIDVGLGRILDGHLNAVQRLVVQVPDAVAAPDLARVTAGELRLGVWGADPGPGEGEPARLRRSEDGGWRLDGVKTFCSGGDGLHRAFVLARGPDDDRPPRLAYVDLTEGTAVDPTWFGGAGMRGSASDLVRFTGARVMWVADHPGALTLQPWFAQDGLRTAASWAGGADRIADDTLAALRAKGAGGDLEGLAVARILGARRAIDLWLDAGAGALAGDHVDAARETLLARDAVAAACRTIADEASRLVGSRPFAHGGRLERARRDLATYLLQHRLEPMLARLGTAALVEGAG